MVLREIGYDLRSEYMAKFENAVTVGGGMVPFYDMFVPKIAPNFFVVVRDIYSADDSLKCGYGGDVHSSFDIVTRFHLGEGTSRIAEEISGQIKALLVPNTLVLEHFHIMNTIPVIDKIITEETNTGRIIRKILTFKHSVQQLN